MADNEIAFFKLELNGSLGKDRKDHKESNAENSHLGVASRTSPPLNPWTSTANSKQALHSVLPFGAWPCYIDPFMSSEL